jgi:hypothetical protein
VPASLESPGARIANATHKDEYEIKEAAMTEREDPKGERGGTTGKTKQKGKGPLAEKGDQRRGEHNHHSGPTRPGGSSRGKPGSESNAESDDQ